MHLSNEERMLVNSEVSRKGKNMLLAYILLIFLGSLGIHRFYLDKKGTAIIQLTLAIFGWATSWLLIGFVPLFILGIWLFVDLFLVPGMVNSANRKVEEEVIRSLHR